MTRRGLFLLKVDFFVLSRYTIFTPLKYDEVCDLK
jgi:hypothetical protein